MDAYYGLKLIEKAYKEKTNSIIWDMWISLYPNMDKDHFISFEDFKKQNLSEPNEHRNPIKTKEEIYKQADKILEAFNKSKGGKI